MTKRKQKPRHMFYFNAQSNDGVRHEIVAPARVLNAKKTVKLTLATEDLEKAQKRQGFGNTQNCLVSCGAMRQKEQFAHPVVGFIDFQYRTAYVVTKLGANGLPSECVRYVHESEIAHAFDRRDTKTIRRRMKAEGGQITLTLRPRKERTGESTKGGSGTGSDRSRSRSLGLGVGAKRRFAMAHLGLSGKSE